MNDPAQALAGLPHDVRGLAIVPSPIWQWTMIGVGALIAVLLVALVVLWLRRRRRDPQFAVDPWTELVARIRGTTLPDEADTRGREEFYFALSMHLRDGIERRTGINATDLTYSQLAAPLKNRLPLRTAEVDAVLAFLQRADLIKFAEAKSSTASMTEDRDAVRGWVESLRPREGEPSSSMDASQRVMGGAG